MGMAVSGVEGVIMIWILVDFHAAEELQAPINLRGGHWNASISHDP